MSNPDDDRPTSPADPAEPFGRIRARFDRMAVEIARAAELMHLETLESTWTSDPYGHSRKLIIYHLRQAARIAREIAEHAGKEAR